MSPHWTVNLFRQQKGLPSRYELLWFGDGRLMPGEDARADAEVKPSLAPRQAEGPAPARSPAGRGGVTSPTRTNAHSSLGTCEKEITQALRSAHSPYIQFLPLPPRSYLWLVFVRQ